MSKKIYITTTLPYVNAEPHIGFALEIIQADAWARTKILEGYEVVFNTGTDEHGLKIYQKALEEGKDPQEYTNEYAAKFDRLKQALNLSYTNFIRTTDTFHKKAAQEFWKKCERNGDIYKKNYKMKYCVGCELEKTDSELIDNKCPLHPKLEIQTIEEENYFFRFSKYQQNLLELYKKNPDFVVPDFRFNEIKAFVEKGLEDFSISRLKNKMPWGVPVPGDDNHVMYVWFDALINYISTIGWPENQEKFQNFWPGYQTAGKDNLRQQSAIWQAMLLSAGLEPSRQIFIHGFITVDGQKMSKSLGNVVNPFDLIATYGTDAVRYYLLREIPSLDDGNFSYSRMEEVYNSDLANELGNLAMRLTTIAEKDSLQIQLHNHQTLDQSIVDHVHNYQFNQALELLWQKIKQLNRDTDEFAPWKKTSDERKKFLENSLLKLHTIAILLQPFMPETAEKIQSATIGTIKKIQPLFPKKNIQQ
jgi:methionyl-tRNA synthetase